VFIVTGNFMHAGSDYAEAFVNSVGGKLMRGWPASVCVNRHTHTHSARDDRAIIAQ